MHLVWLLRKYCKTQKTQRKETKKALEPDMAGTVDSSDQKFKITDVVIEAELLTLSRLELDSLEWEWEVLHIKQRKSDSLYFLNH